MEQLKNEFTVNRSIEHTWQVLTDLERIAPCMPGAQLQEVEGEIYRGVVKVKLGPIATSFKGQATFLERNDAAYTATLKGEGRDTGGKGNADALITATLEAVSADTTKVTVSTDLRITGKVAQFGRGVMGDVSEKLMAQFANNLNTMLDAEPAAEAPAAPTEEASAAEAPTTEAPAAAAPAAEVRTINSAEAAPLELSGVAGTAVLKRLVPTLVVVAAIVIVLVKVL
jgi:carbon monoxide dehydrogenase subunit G